MSNEQNDKILEALKAANELCRSMHSITMRGGNLTNWEAFESQLSTQLRVQHEILYPNAPKPNHHIIVGPGRKCLCGVYPVGSLSCEDILSALNRIEVKVSVLLPRHDTLKHDASLVTEVIKSLVEDCK